MSTQLCDRRPPFDTDTVVRAAWSTALGGKAANGDSHLLRQSIGLKRLMRLQEAIHAATGTRLSMGVLLQLGSADAVAQALVTGRFPPPSSLLSLRDGSPARSMFIVAAASGLVLELCDLANALQFDGTLWGLQLPGIDGECPPLRTIDAMARHHVAAIEARGVPGTISLLGYSGSGLIVVEMARLLQAAGRTVELIGLIDAGVYQRYWPRLSLLQFALGKTWRRLREMRGMSATAALQHLKAQIRAVQRLRDRRRRHAGDSAAQRSIYYIPDLPPDLQRVRDAAIMAFEAHAPRPVIGRTVLFRAALGDQHACDPAPVWRRLAPQLQVVTVPGSHVTMVRKPHVLALARAVALALQEVRAPPDLPLRVRPPEGA